MFVSDGSVFGVRVCSYIRDNCIRFAAMSNTLSLLLCIMICSIGVLELVSSDVKTNRLVIPIDQHDIIRIGRSKQLCDIIINSIRVSLLHCMIWSVKFDKDTPALVYIKDMALNGTTVNGEMLGKGTTRVLENLDTIEIQSLVQIVWKRLDELEIDLGLALDIDMDIDRRLFSHVAKVLDWTITNTIVGSGSYGTIYVGHNSRYSTLFAVKVIRNYSSDARKRIIHESQLLTKICHPNIIKVHDTHVRGSHLYIMEDLICGGDLFSYLSNGTKLRALPESETIFIIYQLLQALDYLHNHLNVLHRDIKLDNVLLDLPVPGSRVYLCDFGTAKQLSSTLQRTRTVVGTAEYLAPEIFNSIESTCSGYNNKCDMWALGVMLCIMLSGISPFARDDHHTNHMLLIDGFAHISKQSKNFVKRLLYFDIRKRMSVTDCLKHVWITGNEKRLASKYSKVCQVRKK